MRYVTDSHPLFWLFTNDKKLTKIAQEIFDKAEKGDVVIIIPSIALLELMYILEKKNLENKFKEIIKKLREIDGYVIYPLDLEVIREVSEISNIKELHDRIIVATAKLLNCPLITKDENITKSKQVECIW